METQFLTPEMIAAIVQTGGTPAILLLIGWKAWNGTSKKINDIIARLVRIETILEERDD